MTKRKNRSPDFKAKVALEAIREEMTMAELSKKHCVQEHIFWIMTASEINAHQRLPACSF